MPGLSRPFLTWWHWNAVFSLLSFGHTPISMLNLWNVDQSLYYSSLCDQESRFALQSVILQKYIYKDKHFHLAPRQRRRGDHRHIKVQQTESATKNWNRTLQKQLVIQRSFCFSKKIDMMSIFQIQNWHHWWILGQVFHPRLFSVSLNNL